MVYEHARHLKAVGHEVVIIYREYIAGRDNNFSKEFGIDYLVFDDIDVTAYDFDIVIATWWETFYDIFLFNARHYFYLSQDDERRFYEDANSFKVKFCNLTYQIHSIGIITISGWWQKQLQKEGNQYVMVAPNGYNSDVINAGGRVKNDTGKLRVLIEGPGDTWFRRIDDSFKAVAGLEGIEVWYKSRGKFIDPSWKYDKVFFNVSSAEMTSIYSQCDVLLKMSEVEAFCLPNLEMMATGGTIITTNFTGHEEYAVPDSNAIVVAIRDIEAARKAVVKLRDDRVLLARLQANAYQTAQTMKWTVQTVKFEKVLMELVEKFEGHDYSHTRRLMNDLLSLKTAVEISEKSKHKLENDYNYLFAQHHRNEYRLFRFIGRMVYGIPVLGQLLRTIFAGKTDSR